MSFLNGAELIMNFRPDTPEEAAKRLAAEAAQAVRDADVSDITGWLAGWRAGRGLPETASVTPEGWPFEDDERRSFIAACAA